jgi:hypothetical protein
MRVRLAAALAALACGTAGAAAAAPQASPEQRLADRYAPIVALKKQSAECDDGGERWRPTAVDIVLGNPDVSLRGPGEGHPVVAAAPTAADLFGKGEGWFLDFPGNPLNPGCRYERDGRRFADGKPSVAYAHVVTDPEAPGRLALQYWFYYYFNDYNNVHESDWEGIQLTWDVGSVDEALRAAPVRVGYAQHEGGEGADWDSDKLRREGDHPIVYAASGSHASYFDSKLWLGRSAREGIGCDNTLGPSRLVPLQAIVVPTSVDSAHAPFAWLGYEGLWGQREKAPNNGPTGPNTKGRWSDPFPWQDDLRDASVAVPGGAEIGTSVSDAFCGTVAFGSDVLKDYFDSPGIVIVTALLFAALAIWILLRTRWRPTTPEPIRAERGCGQILGAAMRLYWRHKRLFLGIGSLSAFAALLVAAVEQGIASLSGGHVNIVFAPVVAAIAVSAAATVALAHLADGVRPSRFGAYRLVLRKAWRLLGASLLAYGGVALLALTIVGIPLAIRQLVCWAFTTQEVMLQGETARGSLGASSRAVRGSWWRVATMSVVLYALGIASGPVVGFAFLLGTSLDPALVDLIGALVYTVTIPYVAIARTLLYFDLKQRHAEAPERAGRPAGPAVTVAE